MIIEFGNHCALPAAVDDRPKVTRLHIPEADETGQGGYTHSPGLSVAKFTQHVQSRLLGAVGYPIFRLPGNEIALLAVQEAWRYHCAPHLNPTFAGGDEPEAGQPDLRPNWVRVRSHEAVHGQQDAGEDGDPIKVVPHDETVCADLERFLAEFYNCDQGAPGDLEARYHTVYGPPGVGPGLPPLRAMFMNDGRLQQAINYGGGQVGAQGVGSAAGATTLTSGSTWTTNQWTGYRIIVTNASGASVWGNIISNTNAVGASVATVDRWYNFATPGGTAGTTPASGFYWCIPDGGMTSAWFVGLTTTNITPAATDHTLSGEYTTAGGGMIRKIAPYALTSGTAPMTYTLTPVFTATGSDTFPSVFYAIGVFASMVTTFGGSGGPMKFETSLNASATINAIGDQLTVTETVQGS